MNLGNKFLLLHIILFFFTPNVFGEEKITSAPLLNLDNIKPSFEEPDKSNDSMITEQNIKKNMLVHSVKLAAFHCIHLNR